MRKSAGRCIFCRGSGLSKEHLIDACLGPVFSRGHKFTEHIEYVGKKVTAFEAINKYKYEGNVKFGEDPHFSIIPHGYRRKSGDLSSRRVRVVCERCNTGWMRAVTNNAKPLLEKLINHDRTGIEYVEAHHISTWMIMKTMVGEFALPGERKIGVHRADYHEIYSTRKPLKNWHVSIYNCKGNSIGRLYQHVSGRIDIGETKKFQSTALVVGGLMIHSFSSGFESEHDFSEPYPECRFALHPHRKVGSALLMPSITDIDVIDVIMRPVLKVESMGGYDIKIDALF